MAFKSGFTNEHSAVRDVMAPGPLREAAGFHYQEFTNLAEPLKLIPDPFGVGDQNLGSVWAEFIMPDTAETLASLKNGPWQFPAITRNQFGRGTLTYEATAVTPMLQREIIRDVLQRAGLTGPDQRLPLAIRVRHGRNGRGATMHYYFNFSSEEQTFTYPYRSAFDVLNGNGVESNQSRRLKPWDVLIVAENQTEPRP